MKPLHLFLLDVIMAAAAVSIITSCVTPVPPSLQVQADVGDTSIAPSGQMMVSASPQHASRAASQTASFYGGAR